MRITRYPIAPGIQPAGDVDHHRTGMRRKPFLRHPVEHDGASNHAAVHGGILVCKGKIVVQPLDDFFRFCVVDRTAAAALFRPCVNGLQHGLRHAGELDFFFHVIFPPISRIQRRSVGRTLSALRLFVLSNPVPAGNPNSFRLTICCTGGSQSVS